MVMDKDVLKMSFELFEFPNKSLCYVNYRRLELIWTLYFSPFYFLCCMWKKILSFLWNHKFHRWSRLKQNDSRKKSIKHFWKKMFKISKTFHEKKPTVSDIYIYLLFIFFLENIFLILLVFKTTLIKKKIGIFSQDLEQRWKYILDNS